MTEELILEDSPFIDAIEKAMKGMLNKFQKPYDWVSQIRYFAPLIHSSRWDVIFVRFDKDSPFHK